MNAHSKQELSKYTGKMIWLASFPKSGNTWFRAFLHALFHDNNIELNHLFIDFQLAQRAFLEKHTYINSRYFHTHELTSLRHAQLSQMNMKSKRVLFVKTHELYDPNIITPQNTHHIIYIVRHPYAVCSSIVNAQNLSIKETIKKMGENAKIGVQPNGVYTHNKLTQTIGSWSSHVSSWLHQNHSKFTLLKYEDMKQNTHNTFSKLLRSLGLTFSEKQISTAIQASSFEKLKQQESLESFREKSHYSSSFFHKGNNHHELTLHEQQSLYQQHQHIMEQLGYF